MRRHAVSLLALVLALAGTGLAVTGAGIRDGSLSAADFAKRSLRAEDFTRSALRGPRGFGGAAGPPGDPGPTAIYDFFNRPLESDLTVAADGTLTSGGNQYVLITHPAAGVYCLDRSYASYVQATSLEPGRIVAADVKPVAPCPSSTQVQVAVFTAGGTPVDGAFQLILSQ